MAKKLYVGNLSYDTSESDLRKMFEEHGTVESAQIIMDRDTGRSKGFAFVEMSSDQEAQAAINALNGRESGGRALTVNEARPREDRGGGRSGGGRPGGGRGGYGGGGGGRRVLERLLSKQSGQREASVLDGNCLFAENLNRLPLNFRPFWAQGRCLERPLASTNALQSRALKSPGCGVPI